MAIEFGIAKIEGIITPELWNDRIAFGTFKASAIAKHTAVRKGEGWKELGGEMYVSETANDDGSLPFIILFVGERLNGKPHHSR